MAEALKEAGLKGSAGSVDRGEGGRAGQYADTFSNSTPQMAAYRVAAQQAESTARAHAVRTAREQAAPSRNDGYGGHNRPWNPGPGGVGNRGQGPAGPQRGEKPSRTAMQDEYLKRLSESGTPVQLICFEGYQFLGVIKDFDTYGVLIAGEDGDDLLFKHGIIAIRPAQTAGLASEAVVEPAEDPVREAVQEVVE